MRDRRLPWRALATRQTLMALMALMPLMALTVATGCVTPLKQPAREVKTDVPANFGAAPESGPTGPSLATQAQWDTFFADPHLKGLIELALKGNQELDIRLQEVLIAQAEVGAAQGEYRPRLEGVVGAGVEKVGEHTSQGVSDESHGVAAHLPDFRFGLRASWEIDAWGRMRDAAKAANHRYLSSIEARNFVMTEVIAEIARAYWDLVALDEQRLLLEQNIELQRSALEMVKAKKAAARGNELEVQRFQAEVLKSQGRIFEVERQRAIVENRINFLIGRFPQPITRDSKAFQQPVPAVARTGLPAALLDNRPDVRAAGHLLEAAKLDTRAAKARFYPSLSIEAEVGYQAFNATHLVSTPESVAYGLFGNLVAPLLNRAGIEADYQAANARQMQAVLTYEQALLRAFTEVANELATLKNLDRRFERVTQQVAVLEQAIEMSTVLFRSAEADYLEVLLTQREALEAKLELLETKKEQRHALVEVFKALGGGWRKKEAP